MTVVPDALRVADLDVSFSGRTSPSVHGAGFAVRPGHLVAIVGASGSGKTTVCRALIGLLPPTAHVSGSIRLAGQELSGRTEAEMCGLRGSSVGMVFQDADRSLDPTMRIGEQVIGALRLEGRRPRQEARVQALTLLRRAELAEPERVSRQYAHELSGGMRQRVAIAIALAREPSVLIADEPTTALDVTTQAAIMRLLVTAQRRTGLAVVLVTHDIALACAFADGVVVMHGGAVVDTFEPGAVRASGRSLQTRRLVRAADELVVANRGDSSPGRPPPHAPVVELTNVEQTLLQRARGSRATGEKRAVAGVSLAIGRGETLALIGGSGSGKTTLARSILHAPAPTGGEIRIGGVALGRLTAARRREHLRRVRIVPQNPFATMDPTWTIARVVGEPLRAFGAGGRAYRRDRVEEVLALVGLDPAECRRLRRAHLSGGQVQLVAIARALVDKPALIILDEAVSSLDAVTKVRILTLLQQLQDELDLSYLFIAHDLGAVRRVSDRVAVMYDGRICEIGPTSQVLDSPRHPYSAMLCADDPALGFGRSEDLTGTAGQQW